MGDIRVDTAGLADLSAAVRTTSGALDALGESRFGDQSMGGVEVASACEELRDGWTQQRASLVRRLDLLAGFADAVSQVMRDADAAVVTGEA